MMMRYFLGIDIGATKSLALIADEHGRALGLGRAGPGNPLEIGYQAFSELLSAITTAALVMAGIGKEQIAGAGFGVAGYDWPAQREAALTAIGAIGLNAPVDVVNDAVIGMLAGTTAGWGVGVVAGTSCNAWGMDRQRRLGRMTGFSWLGEAAGAQELVRKALQAVAHEWTQRGPATRLSRAFVEYAGVQHVEALLTGLTLETLPVGPQAAPIVFRVAREGDPVAQELIRWAGRELGDMAIGVIRQLNLEAETFEVVMAGSFFKGSPVLAEVMGQTIHVVAPEAKLVRLNAPPVVGGVILGMQQADVNTTMVREQLIASAVSLLQ
jgi:N-acetylglucosamine kinase-like BadF-type ATPase